MKKQKGVPFMKHRVTTLRQRCVEQVNLRREFYEVIWLLKEALSGSISQTSYALCKLLYIVLLNK